MIKLLEDAERDHDHIYAIIKGTSINNDGANKIGFTAPSITGQTLVIEDCMGYADMCADDIDYVEAHGTGTHLGDPIEIGALSDAYEKASKPIPVGSIKANIGHLDCAAGMTGVIKSVFMLQNDIIPKNIYFETLNPEINNRKNQFYFPVENEKKELYNIAISSFGLGGTNAHAIVSKYKTKERKAKKLEKYLLPISYIRKEDIIKLKGSIKEFLKSGRGCLQDFVYTMSVGRRRFENKNNIFCVFSDEEDLINQLDIFETSVNTMHEKIKIPSYSLCDFKKLEELLPSYAASCSYLKAEAGIQKASFTFYKTAFIYFLNELNAISLRFTQLNADEKKIWKLVQEEDFNSIEGIVFPEESGNGKVLETLFKYIGKAFLQVDVNFEVLYSELNWGRISAPGYPFVKKYFWVETDDTQDVVNKKKEENRLKISKDQDYTRIIKEIWKEELELNTVNENDDFFDIGGDSLLAISIRDKINKAFSVNLTLDQMMDCTTPLLLAEKLQMGKNNYQPKSYVKKIKTAKLGNINLFLMHPAGGTTFCYRTMMRYFHVDMNIYAFDLPEKFQKFDSMDKLAKEYVNQITDIQQEGEYYIGGYSFGGNLAYEVASQLVEKGKKIAQVYMVDSLPPECYCEEDTNKSTYDQIFPYIIGTYLNGDDNININLSHLAKEGFDDIYEPLVEKAKESLKMTEEEINNFYEKWMYNHRSKISSS